MKMLKLINKTRQEDKEAGIGMVEMIVVLSIIATAFVAIFQLVALERNVQRVAQERNAAHVLAREGMEAARSVRDSGWENIENLSNNTEYYPVIEDDAWSLTTADPGTIGMFTQYIMVDDVRRDGEDNISETGTIDPDTVRVTSVVEWSIRGEDYVSQVETYLTNWQEYR